MDSLTVRKASLLFSLLPVRSILVALISVGKPVKEAARRVLAPRKKKHGLPHSWRLLVLERAVSVASRAVSPASFSFFV